VNPLILLFQVVYRAGYVSTRLLLSMRTLTWPPDMCHAKYYALLEKKRFLAPITDSPQKILDLGCGTGECCTDWAPCTRRARDRGGGLTRVSGIWSIDVADMYPSAEVRPLPEPHEVVSNLDLLICCLGIGR
jgi:hypothetical protein